MSEPKFCPVLMLDNPPHMSQCKEESCAWWDGLSGACCMASGADYIRDVADGLSILILSAQEQKETARGAANTTDGKVDTSDQTVSTSNDN